MGVIDRLLGRPLNVPPPHDLRRVHASSSADRIWYTNDPDIPDWFKGAGNTFSGVNVTKERALKVAVAWRCTNIITGVIAGYPCDLMRRVSETVREPAVGHPFRDVLTVKPNRWQTPGEFKRLMQTRLLLKGNAYAYIRRVGREIRELIPLDPEAMETRHNDDLSISYAYTGRNGNRVPLAQGDVVHLRGLSLDGVSGLDVIAYAKESLGLSVQAEKASAKLFKNGYLRSGVFQTDNALSDNAYNRLKKDLEEKAGADAEDAGGTTILEEGLKWEQVRFSAEQLEFLGLRAFERTDVGMFFGVPPFLYGDTEKSTSWGTGIGQQNIGFRQYTINFWTKIWSEGLKRDCLEGEDPRLYIYFDPKGYFEVELAEQREYFKAALGAGGSPAWMTPNEVRQVQDMMPRPEKWADELPRPQTKQEAAKESSNESEKTATDRPA